MNEFPMPESPKFQGGALFSGDMLVSGRVGLMDLKSTTQ